MRSGTPKLRYCQEHGGVYSKCLPIHESRAIPEPLEGFTWVEFNDGNNLFILDLKLQYKKGKVYYFSKSKKWRLLTDAKIIKQDY